jgi:hypothetical protein
VATFYVALWLTFTLPLTLLVALNFTRTNSPFEWSVFGGGQVSGI